LINDEMKGGCWLDIGMTYFCDGKPGRFRATILSDKCDSYLTEHVAILDSCSGGSKKS